MNLDKLYLSPEAAKNIQCWNDDLKRQKKWDLRFLGLAKYVSTWSRDPSTKTGAVITDSRNRCISLGFNGFPQKLEDKKEYYDDREEKYRRICHCELNAILFAKQDLTNCILYTYPFFSCNNCAKYVIQTGIIRVVAPKVDESRKERWSNELELSKQMFIESGIEVVEYDIAI